MLSSKVANAGLGLRLIRSASTIAPPKRVAFVGAGKMAEAMISPLLKTALLPSPPLISFYEISPSITAKVLEKFPSTTSCSTMASAVYKADLVVIAVKPQNSQKVFESLKPALASCGSNPAVLSIMAGVGLSAMVEGLGTANCYRSMPNTPAMIEQGE